MPLMCQAPEPSAVVAPITLAPLYSVTVLFASALPTMLIEAALSTYSDRLACPACRER